MSPEDFTKLLQDIPQNANDSVAMNALLAKAMKAFEEMNKEKVELKAKNETLAESNEKIRQANMDLFEQLGSKKTDEEPDQDLEEDTGEPPSLEELADDMHI
ncbi:hypothetical protein [Bacillus altitudinis]|uniref:hypothetical protein n=1 Tax=Bacillus altitudinis TaxID=293387 RepID=UPI003D25A81A